MFLKHDDVSSIGNHAQASWGWEQYEFSTTGDWEEGTIVSQHCTKQLGQMCTCPESELSHSVVETHFSCLSSQSCSFSNYLELINIEEPWNVD